MSALRQTKTVLKEAFPSLWLRWHFMHLPKTAEIERSFLKRFIREDAVTVDVGANCGLYTRELARLSRCVHAFEPSRQMADLLRRTSAPNVNIHEVALSDHSGEAALFIPEGERGLVHGLASIEPQACQSGKPGRAIAVPTARLDEVVQDDVEFVKIDVEGHELSVLNGANRLLERCQPVFLVEAEDRHRPAATSCVFEFFRNRNYRGYFVDDGDVLPIEAFDVETFQDVGALLPDGGRKNGRAYINNFFFFPMHQDGREILVG
ncbi:FkbM family methyltransferase [Bradyrhizobium sp. WD16]|nr:FkbM family methyltransferase [Bradyrhizobium sp. WD16]